MELYNGFTHYFIHGWRSVSRQRTLTPYRTKPSRESSEVSSRSRLRIGNLNRMQSYYYVVTALLAQIARSTPLSPRQGAPTPSPIPPNCTVINAITNTTNANTTSNGYMPQPNFTAAHLVYSAYYTSPLTQFVLATQCMQQCYGYGHPGDCKSSLLAYQVPTPAGYYGTAGGVLETACLLFDTYLDPCSFEWAPHGQYVNETAVSIYCP